jgi:hypothetical protein
MRFPQEIDLLIGLSLIIVCFPNELGLIEEVENLTAVSGHSSP